MYRILCKSKSLIVDIFKARFSLNEADEKKLLELLGQISRLYSELVQKERRVNND